MKKIIIHAVRQNPERGFMRMSSLIIPAAGYIPLRIITDVDIVFCFYVICFQSYYVMRVILSFYSFLT